MEAKIGIRNLATIFCMLALLIAGTGMLAEAESTGGIDAEPLYVLNNTTAMIPLDALPPGDHAISDGHGISTNISLPAGKTTMPAGNGTEAVNCPPDQKNSEPGNIKAIIHNNDRTSAISLISALNGDESGELINAAIEMFTHILRDSGLGLRSIIMLWTGDASSSAVPMIGSTTI
jgi:hypothetical protein